MQIKKLEQYLGFELFIRDTSEHRLTDKAQELLPEINSFFSHIPAINQLISKLGKRESKKIILGGSLVLTQKLMPTLLPYINQKIKNVDTQLFISNSDEHIDNLRNKKADIIITGLHKQYKDIKFRKLVQCEIVFGVSGKRYSFLKGPVHIQELTHIPTILPDSTSLLGKHLRDYFERNKVSFLTVENDKGNLELFSSQLVPNSEIGAFFNKMYIEKELAKGSLRIIEIIEKAPPISLYCAYLKSREYDSEIQEFLQSTSNPEELYAFWRKESI